MKEIVCLFIFFSALFGACSDKEVVSDPPSPDHIIFGHFFGECIGEGCVEIFKLTENELIEDTIDQYPNPTEFNTLDFTISRQDKHDVVIGLFDKFPNQLFDETAKSFGMPDAGDWGGIYLEALIEGRRDYWILDHSVDNNPSEYHEIVNEIIDAIESINN